MGKRQVRHIPVPKWITLVLLVLLTAAMLSMVYVLSGRAYASETHSARDLVTRVVGTGDGMTRGLVLAFLMLVIANALLFMPWGFLAFIVFDVSGRRRVLTYFATAIAASILIGAMIVWQEFLTTRVMALPDGVAGVAGAIAGASLAHARKSVRIRFDF